MKDRPVWMPSYAESEAMTMQEVFDLASVRKGDHQAEIWAKYWMRMKEMRGLCLSRNGDWHRLRIEGMRELGA